MPYLTGFSSYPVPVRDFDQYFTFLGIGQMTGVEKAFAGLILGAKANDPLQLYEIVFN